MDNLNTHRVAALYEAFSAHEGRRLAERLVSSFTAEHGIWLNMAVIELSVLKANASNPGLPTRPSWRQKLGSDRTLEQHIGKN